MSNQIASVELSTEKIKRAVRDLAQCAGEEGIFDITKIIAIEGSDGNIVMRSTDRNNMMEITLRGVINSQLHFSTNVPVKLFKAITQKTTVGTCVLDIYDDKVLFRGNGTATFSAVMDGAHPLSIPPRTVFGETSVVKVGDLKKFLTYLKPAIGDNTKNRAYTGYRVHNNVALAFNTYALNRIEIGWDVDVLLPSSLVNLFSTLEGEDAKVSISGNLIQISTPECVIYSNLQSGIEEYDVERLERIVFSNTFSKNSVVDSTRFSETLDRLSLFIDDKLDGNAFLFEADKNEICVISNNKQFEERLKWTSNENEEIVSRYVDITTLKNALSVLKSDQITCSYSANGALRLSESGVNLIVPFKKLKANV